MIVYATFFLLPVIDVYRTSRDVALALDEQLPASEPLVFYPDLRESALFYTDRRGVELKHPEQLEAYLARPGAVCVIDASRTDSIEHLSSRYRETGRWGNKIVVEAVATPVADGPAYIRE